MASEPYIQVFLPDEQKDITASVRSLRVEDHDRLVDEATIVLSDPDAIGASTSSENQSVQITMGWENEHAVLFDGVIRSPAAAATPGERRTTLIAHDRSYGFTIDRRTKVSHVGTLKEVISHVAFNYGFDDKNILPPEPQPKFDDRNNRLYQVDQTDWDFLQELAAKYNCVCFVEFNGDSRKPTDKGESHFYFIPVKTILEADRSGSLHYCQGMSQLIEFKPQKIASQAAALFTTTRVDRMTGEPVTSVAPPADPTPPASISAPHAEALAARGRSTVADGAVAAAAQVPDRNSQIPTTTAAGGASVSGDVDVGPERDPTRVLGLYATGVATGTVFLRAKSKVWVDGIGGWAEGDWYVKRAVHIYNRNGTHGQYRTEFVCTR